MDESEQELALIVGAARSGTTLLRFILDAHPEIGCPAEVGIPSLIQALGRVWWTIDGGEQDGKSLANLPAVAKAAIRAATLAPMSHYGTRWGKRLYCDKSLDSVHHLGDVHELFPKARYVLLFRHMMDTIASGLEASPFGFRAYGYLPFVQRSPDNLVAALANYWLAHVDAALEWEKEHPELCRRLRYEDLVHAPDESAAAVFEFLGVANDSSVLERAFEKSRVAVGPGDYKITFTSGVDASSIGRGKTVPVSMLPPPLLEAANEKLDELGYEPLGAAWNAEPAVGSFGAHRSLWAARLDAAMREASFEAASTGDSAIGTFAIVATDSEELRWVVDARDGEVRQGDGDVDLVVTGTAEALVLMLSREENVGVLLRSGRIRHLTGREDVAPGEVARVMNRILDLLRTDGSRRNGKEVILYE
jgi:protein-tyrosine sulfotransferase